MPSNRVAGMDRAVHGSRSRSSVADADHSGYIACDLQMIEKQYDQNKFLVLSIFAGILAVMVSISAMLISDEVNLDRLLGHKAKRYIPVLDVSDILYSEPEVTVSKERKELIEEPEIVEEPEIIEDTEAYEYTNYDAYAADQTDGIYDPGYLEAAGVIEDDGTKYTWYSQQVLPGEGLNIEGRHVENGYVMDGEGRIVVASSDIPYGTEIELPFGNGRGIVLDTGYLEPGQIDIYTDF